MEGGIVGSKELLDADCNIVASSAVFSCSFSAFSLYLLRVFNVTRF